MNVRRTGISPDTLYVSGTFSGWVLQVLINLVIPIACTSCFIVKMPAMGFSEKQLTYDDRGHTINTQQVFSPDDQWIVYDTRNDDTHIGRTGSIEMVNAHTGETRALYQTVNQTEYGPGVGAAGFSPVSDTVIFIQGIRNSDKEKPYHFSRRTGVAVETSNPFHSFFMDARDITPPFTAGALRGGTHAHSWSGDGQWISFTYNDYIVEQLGKKDPAVQDLRTIGVMAPFGKVKVSGETIENNNGELFSVVAATVRENPVWGSDEIDKAFDECWIGADGYNKPDGHKQKRAIAFQGNVRDNNGLLRTEVFVADMPDSPFQAQPGKLMEGDWQTRPAVPLGFTQRRITHTGNGLKGPRFWLRTVPDGSLIGFLAEDVKGLIQLFGVSPNGGAINQLTTNPFSFQGGFNFSPDGKSVAYIADNSIFLTCLDSGKSERLTARFSDAEAPTGGVAWSNSGRMLAYNRYVINASGKFLQIFVLTNLTAPLP